MGCTPTALPPQAVGRGVRRTLFFRHPAPCLQVQACFLQGQAQEMSSERLTARFFFGGVRGRCFLLLAEHWKLPAAKDRMLGALG